MAMQTGSLPNRRSSPCALCGGSEWQFVRSGRDLYRPGSEQIFTLVRCRTCGLIMQNPLPTAEDLSQGYSAQYAPYRPAWKEPGTPFWKILRDLTTARRLRRLQRYGSGKQMLEVGCGAGDFLFAAHRAGWQVKAVEYSEALAGALREELEFDVRSGELIPGLWREEAFDAVVMWSVLEHLREPIHSLRIAAAYLRPGGALFLQIPTRYGVEQGGMFGQYWALLDLPRHLCFLDRKLLDDCCKQAGLQLVVFKTPLLETAWCYFASICNFAGSSTPPLRRAVGTVALGLLSILCLPLAAIGACRGRGTEAFAVAVKR